MSPYTAVLGLVLMVLVVCVIACCVMAGRADYLDESHDERAAQDALGYPVHHQGRVRRSTSW